MTIYAAIAKNRPDFFLHSGDTIYADGPIQAEVKLPDGTLWRNRVTEEVSKPAESLAEFRGRYKYNLLDRNLLALNAQVPMLAQWDDHEVTNNWWPGEPLTRAEHLRKKYADPNVLALQVRAARAFHEYMPMRFDPAEPGRVYRKISYGRWSTCSCSTCAAIAAPTARTARRSTGRIPSSSARSNWRG